MVEGRVEPDAEHALRGPRHADVRGSHSGPESDFVRLGTLRVPGCQQSERGGLQGPAVRKAYGWVALPFNQVPSYFVFGLNSQYTFENMSGFKRLSVFVQVDNLFNRPPPFAASPTGFFGGETSYGGTNPIFFDTLGLRYRAGFRLLF